MKQLESYQTDKPVFIGRNQMSVLRNECQGKAKKVLCVCSAGILRSPTTAAVLSDTYGYNTRSAGVSSEYALVPVTPSLVEWADEIVFMENGHKLTCNIVLDLPRKPFQVLDILDNYNYMDDGLVNLILERYKVTE